MRRLLSADIHETALEIYDSARYRSVIDLTEMTHLTNDQYSIASLLRDRIDHLRAASPAREILLEMRIMWSCPRSLDHPERGCCCPSGCQRTEIVQECVRQACSRRGFRYLQIAVQQPRATPVYRGQESREPLSLTRSDRADAVEMVVARERGAVAARALRLSPDEGSIDASVAYLERSNVYCCLQKKPEGPHGHEPAAQL